MRYWYHPESDSLWTTEEDGFEAPTDGLVEEIDEAEYNRLKGLQEAHSAS